MSGKYKEALLNMVYQFADNCKKDGLPAYGTAGLSALENAFDVLGWDDPHPCPENKCDLCNEWATCGTPAPPPKYDSKTGMTTSHTKNYYRVCGKHYSELQSLGGKG